MIFPWQSEQWKQLARSRQENRLPHALLFTGIAGTGKAKFAYHFSRLLLCQRNSEETNCDCHNCRLIAGRAHPNVLWIEPEKAGQAIKVDQIREVSDFINHSSFHDGYRLVVVNPANAMNASAANALLKTLEEPSSGAIMVLVSDQHARLPATILSRCQRIIFPRPKKEAALSWLKLQLTDKAVNPEWLLNIANGAPFAALRLIEDDTLTVRQELFQALYSLYQKQGDPLALAARTKEVELTGWLDLVLSWLKDLVLLQLTDNQTELINQDYIQEFSELKQKTVLQANIKFMEYVQRLRGQLSLGFNLNKQLVVESVFIKWAEER